MMSVRYNDWEQLNWLENNKKKIFLLLPTVPDA